MLGHFYCAITLDGQRALKEIRRIEEENGIFGLSGVKIIMTTALGDFRNISTAFTAQCEAYLVKPLEEESLTETLRKLELIE